MKLAIIKERARVGLEIVFYKKNSGGLLTKSHQFSPNSIWSEMKKTMLKSKSSC
jgi:hypothetical protein